MILQISMIAIICIMIGTIIMSLYICIKNILENN